MEIMDLLSGFDLNKLKDSDVQAVARGITNTLIFKPMEQIVQSGQIWDQRTTASVKEAAEAEVIRYMKKALGGGIFDKISIVASVTKNAKKARDFPPVKIVDANTDALVEAVTGMHVHHLTETDYRRIAEELAVLAFDQGLTAQMLKTPAVYDRNMQFVITQDILSRIYAALKIAVREKDDLISMAEESQKNGK